MTVSDQSDEKLSALYKKSADVEPPAPLDRAILAASKQTSGSRSRSIPPKADYWHWPAALASVAAVVIISILIVPLMLEDKQHEKSVSYGLDQAENLELKEETQSEPVASSPAIPARSPIADQMSRQLSSPMKARQQSATSARMKQETIDTEADAMPAEPAGFAAAVAPGIPAEQRLDSIKRLIEEGNYRQAADELAELRLAYPEYPVDAALIRVLKDKIEPTTPLSDRVK